MNRVLCILTDNTGKTIGAKVQIENKVLNIKTDELSKNSIKFENATVDRNGFVRSKKGRLEKVMINTKPNSVEHRDSIEADRIKKETVIIAYHGTTNNNLVPNYKYNNKNNDYGKGFYTTPDIELAREWAYAGYTSGDIGYTYKYEIDTKGLNILDFTKLDSLHWVAELIYNRKVDAGEDKEVYEDNKKKIIEKYKLRTSYYDIIIGYRADDSYYQYAKDFVTGVIYRDTIEKALRFGKLGLQVFVKSERAFMRLKKIDGPVIVDARYRDKFIARDKAARDEYRRERRNQSSRIKQRIYDFID